MSKKLFDRYVDTVIYILTMVILATLVVTTVELQEEVTTMKASICDLEADVRVLTKTCAGLQKEVQNSLREAPTAITKVSTEDFSEPKLYTDSDAIALAQVAWGEARGVPVLNVESGSVSTECQQAAVMWTVLNRYDSGEGDSIVDVVAAENQFQGYSASYPVEDDLLALAYDVLDRWNREKNGEIDIFRELPKEYMWFHGDGTYNYFRNKFRGGSQWTWEGVLA